MTLSACSSRRRRYNGPDLETVGEKGVPVKIVTFLTRSVKVEDVPTTRVDWIALGYGSALEALLDYFRRGIVVKGSFGSAIDPCMYQPITMLIGHLSFLGDEKLEYFLR